MSTKDIRMGTFLKGIMQRRKRLPSQLASDIGVSHSTMLRWLNGDDIPSTRSCKKLAEHTGITVEEILNAAGHIARISNMTPVHLPEFREYAQQKYPDEIDEDIINMIEDLIERRRDRKRGRSKS